MEILDTFMFILPWVVGIIICIMALVEVTNSVRNLGILKTVRFNLIPFTVALWVCWISFSALTTLSDDPFVYGTWPDVVAAESLREAFSLIIGEIIDDFHLSGWRLAIYPAALISWRASRGYRKGVAKEDHIWTAWYRRQENTIAAGNTFEEGPPVRENMPTGFYFGKAQSALFRLLHYVGCFIVHFSCWFAAIALFVTISELLVTIRYPFTKIIEPGLYLVRHFPEIVILAIIHALLSSYYEIRGTIRGTAETRRMWTQWYDRHLKWDERQQDAKTYGYTLAESPPLPPLDAS